MTVLGGFRWSVLGWGVGGFWWSQVLGVFCIVLLFWFSSFLIVFVLLYDFDRFLVAELPFYFSLQYQVSG